MSRTPAGLARAAAEVRALREEFRADLRVPGGSDDLNQELEKAGRVADYLELAELMCVDALAREESCGAHFRGDHQTPDGEAQRDDERFAHVAVWEHVGDGKPPERLVEPLVFESVAPAQRSYK